jgi:hypothetical protein
MAAADFLGPDVESLDSVPGSCIMLALGSLLQITRAVLPYTNQVRRPLIRQRLRHFDC